MKIFTETKRLFRKIYRPDLKLKSRSTQSLKKVSFHNFPIKVYIKTNQISDQFPNKKLMYFMNKFKNITLWLCLNGQSLSVALTFHLLLQCPFYYFTQSLLRNMTLISILDYMYKIETRSRAISGQKTIGLKGKEMAQIFSNRKWRKEWSLF